MGNKIYSSLLIKSDVIPESKSSVALKKESVQPEAENKQGQLLLTPPYDTAALATLYNLNAYHKRCCLVKAGVTVRLGFSIYDPDKLERKPDEEHERIKTFVETSIEVLHDFQLDQEIFGNSYLEIVRNGKGEVAEIFHIGAKETSIRIENKIRILQELIGGTNIYYIPYLGEKYQADGKNRHEYIHLKNYNPENRYYGAPEYTGAISAMYLDESAKTFNTNRFSNPVPESIIKMFGFEKDDETLTNIKNFFTNNFGDRDKSGKKVLVLWSDSPDENKIVVDKMEADIKDASYRGMRDDNTTEIIAAHGLSPRVVGIESRAKLGGGGEVREQLRLINELVFIPRKKALARVVNNLILGMGIKGWRIKFDNFEFVNATEDATFYSTMVAAGIVTKDEARSEMGYEVLKPDVTLPDAQQVADNVQAVGAQLMLNGIQIQAATKIVQTVSSGDIPRDSGKNQLKIFFNLTDEQAELLLGDAGTGERIIPDKKVTGSKAVVTKSDMFSNLAKELRAFRYTLEAMRDE